MKRMKLYKNYGCLASEKKAVYTYGNPAATATCWDEIEIEIPEGFELAKNVFDELLITSPFRIDYLPNEILRSGKECPQFEVSDSSGNIYTYNLTVLN